MKWNLLFIVIYFSLFLIGCDSKEKIKIDHIILAINALDLGIEKFEELTGLHAEYGGDHSNSFTHNAIVSLNKHTYIEILAPKKGLDSIPDFFKDFHELKPIGFAISISEIELLEKSLKNLGFSTQGVEDWSRKKTNGDKLKWKLLQVEKPDINVNPFFIKWSEETGHPTSEINVYTKLEELELITPFNIEINQILASINSKVDLLEIKDGNIAQVILSIQSPKGRITFK
ncbi:MAG: hypothetical protein CMO01_05985 [Thalassobius sp.]|nr:hypothetical protein [Thalassovita sp.]